MNKTDLKKLYFICILGNIIIPTLQMGKPRFYTGQVRYLNPKATHWQKARLNPDLSDCEATVEPRPPLPQQSSELPARRAGCTVLLLPISLAETLYR